MLGVAQKLNEFEKENEGTYRWTVAKIRTVLMSVSYIGDLYCGSTYTADYLSKKEKKNNGERESYYITEHHDPIISKEDFNKAAELRNARNRRTDSVVRQIV